MNEDTHQAQAEVSSESSQRLSRPAEAFLIQRRVSSKQSGDTTLDPKSS
jgi:hypothetical protein